MKTTEITKIDVEDRVLTIGKYNAFVNFCPYCHPEYIDLGITTVIGYGTDKQGYVVEVHECPKCFKKSQHHLGDFHCYDIHKMLKNRNK